MTGTLTDTPSDEPFGVTGTGASPAGVSTAHRVRGVLAIPAFRRLWAVTSVAGVGEWLSLLALSALATKLTTGYQAQSFALGGVVATKLLPAMLLAPLAGVLADKFDRRRLMIVCDLARCALLVSVPLVGSLWWLFVATFAIEICAMFWQPAKDAAIPNLLRRPDQVETANQLSLVMTYGVSVVLASGLFSALTAATPVLGLPTDATGPVYLALLLNGLAYLVCAVVVATRIPEISGRSVRGRRVEAQGQNILAMLRDGLRYVVTEPLVRGLVFGIIGAFAAGGAVIACAKLYAVSLSGGDAAYGMLFVATFLGLGTGMATAPRFARRLAHNRLFGLAIIGAGCALLLVAAAPHLWVALGAVLLVGWCAGAAFLTGLTIIGSRVRDEIRGRTVAFVQALVRVDLLLSMALVPLIVGLVTPMDLTLFGADFRVDATRPVLAGAGLLAAALGFTAYRQMARRDALFDGLADFRPRRPDGLLICLQGWAGDTSVQARRLADRLADAPTGVVLAADPAHESDRVGALLGTTGLTGVRARALLGAAVHADVVERRVMPALRDGAVVITQRCVDGLPTGITADEVDVLRAWADQSRVDVTVLLDRRPPGPGGPPNLTGEHHWRVQRIMAEMAADSSRYVVVDADGDVDEVAERVRAALRPVLATRGVEVDGSVVVA